MNNAFNQHILDARCCLQYVHLIFWFVLQMSMWRCSDELRHRADVLHRSSKKDAKHYIGNCNRNLLSCSLILSRFFYFFGYKGFENVFTSKVDIRYNKYCFLVILCFFCLNVGFLEPYTIGWNMLLNIYFMCSYVNLSKFEGKKMHLVNKILMTDNHLFCMVVVISLPSDWGQGFKPP